MDWTTIQKSNGSSKNLPPNAILSKPSPGLFERIRLLTAAALVGIISIGGLILLFQDRQIKYQQSNLQPIVDGLKKENETLKAKVDELTKEANELKKTNAELENQTSQPMINRSVKGASIANPKNAVPNQVIDKQTTNLNTATATELDRLPGIGPVYTQRIIDYRDQHGGFKTIEEIQNVKGIGPKTFEKIEGMIGVE